MNQSANIDRMLMEAFQLGQLYWQQADSESYKQNAKAANTRDDFEDLRASAANLIAEEFD